MECPKCQTLVSERARFCDQCGASLIKDVGFLHQRALEHYHRGILDQALLLWDDVIKEDPEFARAHYYKGMAHYDRGELDKAVDSFKRALKNDKEPFRVYFKLGMAL